MPRKGLPLVALTLAMASLAMPAPAVAQEGAAQPVILAPDTQGTPGERAAATLAQMRLAEKLTLLKGYFATDFPPVKFKAPEQARYGSAGYVPGIARLGIPPQWQADAGLGVATQGGAAEKRARTALPSGLATAATWDPALAYAGGAMIGAEARADGFNVLLGGSVNLMREPRNGRNFEYAGEDPLLAGTMVGAQIAGVQSNHVISTAKHFAVNDQETDRNSGNFLLDEAALRMSDLLAFQFAFEKGDPGAAMCAYNLFDGLHACEQPFLLTQVLRNEWGWPGYVMSDWGAVHSTAPAANAGLDQESGYGLQMDDWFGREKLETALAAGEIDEARIDLMAESILRSMFAHGLIDDPASEGHAIDFAAHQAVSRADAEGGIVLLKNEGGILPLAQDAKVIAVIGGHADKGVLSGGGSSQVYPDGTNAVPGIAPTSWPGPVVYYPSSPLEELGKLLPGARFGFADGSDPAAAARLAKDADLVVVFGTQWASESIDVAMALDGDQDALIGAVADANPNTVVVLETGGPVMMPWADKVPAILEAWYPGRAGGEAIANVLAGKVNPSGRLPATFPKSLDQLPYPGEPRKGTVTYSEGATVGYKWFASKGLEPLFPFGHGLSYTSFRVEPPKAPGGAQPELPGFLLAGTQGALTALVNVTNIGERAGSDVVQIYVSGPPEAGWEAPRRLGGFTKVSLEAGEDKLVGIAIDPRLLAVWDEGNPGWSRKAGRYTVTIARDAADPGISQAIELPALHLPPEWKP